MKYKNILVTGGRGFIMFNGLQLWKKMFPDCNFVCVDADTYADKFMQKEKNKWLDANGISRFVIDLSKSDAYDRLCTIVEKYHIDAIIHGAAESHVDNSIKTPNVFFESNVIGTVNLLNVARKYKLRTHIISTDEVYGETDPSCWEFLVAPGVVFRPRSFEMPLKPSSPYSSSKASADLIAISYNRTYDLMVSISRCTNNAGKWQHSEKLIGTVISKVLKNEKIPVYGNGAQKRHWIHVDDHNRAVMHILENFDAGIYNIAPEKENWITNLELIEFILKYLGKTDDLIEHVTDRPGHDLTYFLTNELDSIKTRNYKEFMPEVIDWYKEQFESKGL